MGLGSTGGWPHLPFIYQTHIEHLPLMHCLHYQEYSSEQKNILTSWSVCKYQKMCTRKQHLMTLIILCGVHRAFLSSIAFYSCIDRQRPWSTHIEMKIFIQLVENSIALSITTYTEKHWIFYLIPGCFSIL